MRAVVYLSKCWTVITAASALCGVMGQLAFVLVAMRRGNSSIAALSLRSCSIECKLRVTASFNAASTLVPITLTYTCNCLRLPVLILCDVSVVFSFTCNEPLLVDLAFFPLLIC